LILVHILFSKLFGSYCCLKTLCSKRQCIFNEKTCATRVFDCTLNQALRFQSHREHINSYKFTLCLSQKFWSDVSGQKQISTYCL